MWWIHGWQIRILIVFCTWSLLPSTVHAAATCMITPGSGTYPTISSATSGTSGANCSSVLVPAGTFSEQVTIDHPLSLKGAGSGATILIHPQPGPTTKSFNSGIDYVMHVTSNDVNIDGFTVDGGGYACQTAGTCLAGSFIGIYFNGINSSLTNSIVQHIGTTDLTHGFNDVAIEVYPSGKNGQVTITNTTIQSFSYTAILTVGSTWVVFRNGTVIGSGPDIVQSALILGAGSVVADSVIKNIHYKGTENVSHLYTDIALLAGGNVYIQNNTFDNDDNAVVVTDGPALIQGNHFTHSQSAIVMTTTRVDGKNTVTDNSIDMTSVGPSAAAPGTGIVICESGNNTISRNTITNSATTGIAVFSKGDEGCNKAANNNTITNNTIHSSGSQDIKDETSGSATKGTANIYSNNVCGTSVPAGLCLAPTPAPTATPVPAAPTVTAVPPTIDPATPISVATPSTNGTATPITAIVPPSSRPIPPPSGSFQGPLLAVVGLTALIFGGLTWFFFSRRARLRPRPWQRHAASRSANVGPDAFSPRNFSADPDAIDTAIIPKIIPPDQPPGALS